MELACESCDCVSLSQGYHNLIALWREDACLMIRTEPSYWGKLHYIVFILRSVRSIPYKNSRLHMHLYHVFLGSLFENLFQSVQMYFHMFFWMVFILDILPHINTVARIHVKMTSNVQPDFSIISFDMINLYP